jgi:ATP-dependent Clp protease ATP-binding subunit ClpA
LTPNIVRGVVDKFLMELQAQLDDKAVSIHATADASDWLAEKGYDEKMGARPMRRLIQEKIKKPLAEMILFGELAEAGGSVEIGVGDDGELRLTITEKEMATV